MMGTMKRTELRRVVLWAALVTVLLGGTIALITWPFRDYLLTTYARRPEPSGKSKPFTEEDKAWFEREAQRVRRQHNQNRGRLLAESFVADVQAGYLDRTYDAFAVYGDGAKMGREAFVSLLRKQPRFSNPQLPMRIELTEGGERCFYSCNAFAEDGTVVQLWVGVMLEGEPKLKYFRVGNAAGITAEKAKTNE